MKNRSVFFLISLLFAQKVFCFELKQTPKIEVFTQFEANKNLYIIYHNAYVEEDKVIMKKAYDEGKFVLFVYEIPFDEYFYEDIKTLDKHSPFYNIKTPDVEKVFEALRKDKRDSVGATVHLSKRTILEKKTGMIVQNFTTRNYHYETNLIGGYSMNFISRDGNVYHYWLADPCSYINDDKLCKQMPDYFVYEERGKITTYYWKSYEETDRFYDDMVAKKKSLPAYVIKFQETWESIVNSFE